MRMPAEVARHGTSLLNQQFWLWGRDIRRPEGNLLLDYGFAKHPPPPGVRVPSRYELSLPGHRRLTLWGFGLALSDEAEDGLFLGRMKLTPRLTPRLGDIWEPAALPALGKPTTPAHWARVRTLMEPALGWIADYECWVESNHGTAYRQECLDAWPRAVCQAEETANRWRRLAGLSGDSLQPALEPANLGVTTMLADSAVWAPADLPGFPAD